MMSNNLPAPDLEGLKNLVANNRVAVIDKKIPVMPPALPVGRFCANCFFNPSGNICQRLPLDVRDLMVPVEEPSAVIGGAPKLGWKLNRDVVTRVTPPNYRCAEHRYSGEKGPGGEVLGEDWNWTDSAS